MFNRVILAGNLTRDVELRYTPQGTAVANFGIATNRKYGEDKQETFFGEVVVWNKLAETCSNYIRKGSKVLVEGRLTTESWESEGQKKQRTRIVAEQVRFLDAKKDNQGNSGHDAIPQEETGLEPF